MSLTAREEAQLARLTKISGPKSAIELAGQAAGGRPAAAQSGEAVTMQARSSLFRSHRNAVGRASDRNGVFKPQASLFLTDPWCAGD